MTKIKVLAETGKTVTLRRADFQALLAAAEDNADLASVARHRTEEGRLGVDAAKRGYLTREEADRALDGEPLVRIWRQKHGMTQRALAEAARVAVSYLAEIEGGKKPGSREALQRIAEVLEVRMEDLARKSEVSLKPVTRSGKAAAQLAKLAEETADRDHLADEARRIVREWIAIGDTDGVRHQVKAAIGTLESTIAATSKEWARLSIEQERQDLSAARRMKRMSDALEAAIDALDSEYRKL